MIVEFIKSDIEHILSINGWTKDDRFNIQYDELDGEKRIVIRKENKDGI